MEERKYSSISKPVRKKDAMSLVCGKPVYVEDIVPQGYLVVKVLHSPHAHAIRHEHGDCRISTPRHTRMHSSAA